MTLLHCLCAPAVSLHSRARPPRARRKKRRAPARQRHHHQSRGCPSAKISSKQSPATFSYPRATATAPSATASPARHSPSRSASGAYITHRIYIETAHQAFENVEFPPATPPGATGPSTSATSPSRSPPTASSFRSAHTQRRNTSTRRRSVRRREAATAAAEATTCSRLRRCSRRKATRSTRLSCTCRYTHALDPKPSAVHTVSNSPKLGGGARRLKGMQGAKVSLCARSCLTKDNKRHNNKFSF